jgi:hypothetical protein
MFPCPALALERVDDGIYQSSLIGRIVMNFIL